MKLFSIQLHVAALALIVAGCTTMPVTDKPAVSNDMVFEAVMADEDSEAMTRTGNLPSGKMYWSPGDEISVFSRSGGNGGSRFTSTAVQKEPETTFTGSLNDGGWTATSTFTAIYPFSSGNRFDGTYVYTELKDAQQSAAGTLADGQWPTMAKADGFSLEFHNICSGIRFNVASEGVRSVTFRNIDGGRISGTMKVSWDRSGKPQMQEISGGKDEIVVTPETGTAFIPGTDYYVVLPVVTMSRGIEVTFRNESGTTVYTHEGSVSFQRGHFKTLSAKDAKVFNLENQSVSNYLDAAESKYTDDNWSSVTVIDQFCSNSSSNRKDIPCPVTLSWAEVSGSGDYTVSIYNDSALTDLETTKNTSSTSAEIYNLIPKRTYHYTVTRNSAKVAGGSFTTDGRRRMMKVSDTYAKGHANNCRDLGGMKTTDGHTLKHGLIYRGSNMDATTDAEKQYLTGYMNIGMDIDLRNSGWSWGSSGADGSQSASQPFGSSWNVGYSNAGYNSWDDLKNDSKTKTTFTDIINTVKSGKAAYIHCWVGADRTGYICMLLEAVLGVSARDCSIDYELTSFSVVGIRSRTGKLGEEYYFIKGMDYITGFKGSTFKEKAENILLQSGITAQQISDLRNAMLE